MATIDIFNNDAFQTRELTEAINVIPNMFGRIGEMGLFTPKPLRQTQFQIESRNGVLALIQSSERGTHLGNQKNAKREMRDFSTRRFGLENTIKADDIDGIRAFGTESELKQVLQEVNDRLEGLRGSIDITREYLRAGALAGLVLDADGSTIIDLYSVFGITQKVIDFDLGTGPTDHAAKARAASDHVRLNLVGDMMTSVHALCSVEFFDKLMNIADFKDAFKYYTSTVQPLRDDPSGGVPWQGITWEKYLGEAGVPQEDGSIITRRFIAAGDCRIFPVGTRSTFRQFNAPADYMETVGTPGQDFYAKVMPDPKANRFVDVEAQTNTLPVCMRPGVLVRGHSTT